MSKVTISGEEIEEETQPQILTIRYLPNFPQLAFSDSPNLSPRLSFSERIRYWVLLSTGAIPVRFR